MPLSLIERSCPAVMSTAPVTVLTLTVTPVEVVNSCMSPTVVTEQSGEAWAMGGNVAEGVSPGAKFSTRIMSGVSADTTAFRP